MQRQRKEVTVRVDDATERGLSAFVTFVRRLGFRGPFGLGKPWDGGADSDASADCRRRRDGVGERYGRTLEVRPQHRVVERLDLLLIDEQRGVEEPADRTRELFQPLLGRRGLHRPHRLAALATASLLTTFLALGPHSHALGR